jgi:hypothetical protein
VAGGEAVDEMNPDGQRQLLAGDAVHERLEHGGKARWLEAAHALGKRADHGVCRRHRSERREIDAQP